MGWQVTVFVLLALVIAGGVAWYERSRPPARIVALVAALAALAVAGRLVLAPVPNVVATTDVALVTGYALGGAPGFVVGALAAPVSNLWLGQGPWTPWQMAGWGLCGLAGAGLAAATRRRLGRFGFAVACGVAGLAYGALLDLSVMVSYGGEQSLDRYLALSARGIPFNAAHALGNFAIAMAAGPALIRMISRFRERLTFSWEPSPTLSRAAPAAVVAVAIGLALAGGAAPGRAADADPAARQPSAARVWLERAQNRDGGFGASRDARSNAAMTGWAMLGLEAAGRNPLDLRSGGRSPVDYLEARASSLNSAADLERSVLALASAGVNPYDFGGQNLVAELRAKRDSNGSFEANVNSTAFAVFALRAVSAPAPELERSATWLRRAQNRDGGWGFRPDAASDADSTGAALQALAAAGMRGPARARGTRYLRKAQLGDGGFPLASGGASNSQSTAWAVQGLVASGTDPDGVTSAGRSPLDYLAAQQASDGHYRYSQSSDPTPVWVTSQVLLAVNRRALPLARVPRVDEPGGLPPAHEPGRKAGAGGSGGEAERAGGTRAQRAERAGGEREGSAKGERAGEGARKAGSNGGDSHLTAEGIEQAAAGAESSSSGGKELRPALLGGLGALAAGLGAGFVWYRRRLP